MSRSDWGILAAAVGVIVLAIVLALSLNPEQPNLTGNIGYQERPAGYHAGGYNCQPAQVKLLTGRKRLRQEASCADAEQNDRYNADNLIQYRRAADAADASTILAYKQARIAAVGAGLGLITMFAAIGAAWYARDAAKQGRRGAEEAGKGVVQAKRSAEIAKASLKEDRESNKRQLRAYITYKNIKIGVVKHPADAAISRIKVRAIIRNSGQTPAMITGFAFEGIGELGARDLIYEPELKTDGASSLGPDQETNLGGPQFELDRAQLDAIFRGEIKLTFYVVINYRDIFDDEWETRNILAFHVLKDPRRARVGGEESLGNFIEANYVGEAITGSFT